MVPRFGQTVGILLEVTLMTLAIIVAARWTLSVALGTISGCPVDGARCVELAMRGEGRGNLVGAGPFDGELSRDIHAGFRHDVASHAWPVFAIMPILIARVR